MHGVALLFLSPRRRSSTEPLTASTLWSCRRFVALYLHLPIGLVVSLPLALCVPQLLLPSPPFFYFTLSSVFSSQPRATALSPHTTITEREVPSARAALTLRGPCTGSRPNFLWHSHGRGGHASRITNDDDYRRERWPCPLHSRGRTVITATKR